MAILRLSWRGSTNSKKYILQQIYAKKECFYPIHTSATPRRGARNPEISVNPEQDVLRGASRGK